MVPLLLGPPASLLFFYFDLSHATRGLGHNGTKTHTRMKSITKENVEPSCGVGALPREVLWRQLFCRGPGGGAMFTICGSCYRGQVYCGERCRRRMRRQQMRLANRRHQDSPEGRLDRRDRQRVYRAKCRLRVTDHTSARRPRSVNIKEPWTKPRRGPPFGEEFQPRRRLKRPQAAIRAVCIVCGRMRR